MGYESLMIGLHWAFVVGALTFSWRRFHHYLHPHFLFTVMICIFLSDFLIRGYEDGNIFFVIRDNIYSYQLMILFIFSLALLLASFARNDRIEAIVQRSTLHADVSLRGQKMVLLLACSILIADLLKRLISVDWSIDDVIFQSLQARGQRAWDQAAFSGNFAFAITTILLPLAACAFSYLVAFGKGVPRIVAIVGLALVIALLVTNGSRTPVVLALLILGALFMVRQKTLVRKMVMIAIAIGIAATLVSLMYNYRATGYVSPQVASNLELKLAYHQDDSYYRAIYSYYYSDQTGKQWDAGRFFGTVAVNPIPRALWPGKLTLDMSFYDGFKFDYVTSLFLGEAVALFGLKLSLIIAPLLAFGFYLLLYRSAHVLLRPMGLGVYFIVGLYVYMCMRSMMNMTLFIYLPLVALVASSYLQRRLSVTRGLPARPAKHAHHSI
jgi:oligosaccharide repeat unit polymerase